MYAQHIFMARSFITQQCVSRHSQPEARHVEVITDQRLRGEKMKNRKGLSLLCQASGHGFGILVVIRMEISKFSQT